MNEHTEPQFIPADRRLRAAVLAVALVLIAAGAVGLSMIRAELRAIDSLGEEDLPAAVARLRRVVAVVAWLGAIGFVGASAWFFRLGWRINRSGQYPPPGARVIRETPVRVGGAARRKANLAMLAAVLSGTIGTLGMLHFYRTAERVLGELLR